MVKESTNASRVLVLTFIDLVDLYEQILATHYDYTQIRERFKDTGILEEIARVLQRMAMSLKTLVMRFIQQDDINIRMISTPNWNI